MNYSGGAVRGGQLFGEQTAVAMTKKLFKGLQGVENVYTQHKPYILDVLQVRGNVFCGICTQYASIIVCTSLVPQM